MTTFFQTIEGREHKGYLIEPETVRVQILELE